MPGRSGRVSDLTDKVWKRRDGDAAWDMQAIAEVAEERDLKFAAGLDQPEHDVACGPSWHAYVAAGDLAVCLRLPPPCEKAPN